MSKRDGEGGRGGGIACAAIEPLEPRRLLASTVTLLDAVNVPDSLTPIGDQLFFFASARRGGGGRQLWQTDGTAAGTVRLTSGL